MTVQVPLVAVPSQTLNIVLGRQKCQLALYQKAALLYCDLSVNSVSIIRSRVCRNNIRLLLSAQYRGFIGDLVITDTQGDTQPDYTGLGSRYVMLYLEAGDLV